MEVWARFIFSVNEVVCHSSNLANLVVLLFESISGLLDGELPIDFEGFVFPLLDQSQDFTRQLLDTGYASIQTLAR